MAVRTARSLGDEIPERRGLRKTEFVCPICDFTEVRYFPARLRPSRHAVFCQCCSGTPRGTGVLMIAYWLEGLGAHPANPLRHASAGPVSGPALATGPLTRASGGQRSKGGGDT